MKSISNGKYTVVVADDKKETVTTILSWCGTTKFDWFVVQHPNEEDHEVNEDSIIGHVEVTELVDPRFEPLDVVAIHLMRPSFHNAGALTPRISPSIGFALFCHDFTDPSKTQCLVLNKDVTGGDVRSGAAWLKEQGFFKEILTNGFILTPGTTFFTLAELKKIASKFRGRMRKAMR